MLNFTTENIILCKFKEYLGIISVFSCSIFIFLITDMLFFIEQRQKLVRRSSNERRHFENTFLAGNDHVIDIVTSEDMENISLCIFRYLTVCYIIKLYYYIILLNYVFHRFQVLFMNWLLSRSCTFVSIALRTSMQRYQIYGWVQHVII
jgi:hypothetical protein